MMLVLNDSREVLLVFRHRWLIDQWVWELPGGYVDHAENVAATAAREVEAETGWRPRSMQPTAHVGVGDAPRKYSGVHRGRLARARRTDDRRRLQPGARRRIDRRRVGDVRNRKGCLM